MTPQIANNYSVTQGQVNKLQTFSLQQIGISVQQFDSVIQYNAITLSVLLKGYYSYKFNICGSVHHAL